jgi:phosphoserine phosphatase
MNLVLQGPALSKADIDAVADGARPAAIVPLNEKAARLSGATPHDSIAKICEARRIDYAWMEPGRRFADLGLLAMDMDSTLITIECIDELGAMAGRGAEIAAITEAAMRGEIADYQESLRRRVALLEGTKESVLEDVYRQKLRLTAGAEELLASCRKHGVKTLLVSGGFTYFVERVQQRLGIDYAICNRLEIRDGKLTGALLGDIVDAQAKAAKFGSLLESLKIGKQRSVAIGDGANDLKMMARAGLSIAFHAKPVVRAQASCSLTYSGLDGVLNLFE